MELEADYQALKSKWLAGERGRELSLQLLFHAWMHWADPPFVTGLTDDSMAEQLWLDAFDWMGGDTSTDAEFLFVAGIMAKLFPYALGDEHEWASRGSFMQSRASALPLNIFEKRGEYGKYFSHQLGAT